MEFAGRKPLSGGVNLVPLINIVFLLLIFFMVSSTFITPDEFNIDLPESEQVQVSQLQPIVVLIGVDGGLALNNRELDLDDLELSLAAALAIDPGCGGPHQSRCGGDYGRRRQRSQTRPRSGH